MLRRARMLAVLGFLIPGGVGIISSTQTWITVHRTDAAEPLQIAGADALVLLAPLSLAVLALGAALSIAGRALRYVFAVLAAGGAAVLIAGTAALVIAPPLSAAAPALSEATGLAGEKTLRSLVAEIEPTGWPVAALCAWILLLTASVFILATAHAWQAGGRRYRQADETHQHTTGPLDPIDSWDELSHGTDPTGPSR
ncbi:Trp biosynthesis-associated membrane protein [Microbacterium sp. YJN-G]|uniref:Trp biosynthesis-associated membrane protein n=1 Tax=Microbacterium sp. YJN-G TaxID=2763257 RepID=UPI001D0BFA65|nr:Trp biosynthesis-associated membrane protein [Microbacterium sp. YJN-G]